METATDRVEQLEKALSIAQAHIGWLWEIVEENTALRREGSETVLAVVREALGE